MHAFGKKIVNKSCDYLDGNALEAFPLVCSDVQKFPEVVFRMFLRQDEFKGVFVNIAYRYRGVSFSYKDS